MPSCTVINSVLEQLICPEEGTGLFGAVGGVGTSHLQDKWSPGMGLNR